MPHLLRANADPKAAYIDGRVDSILSLIEELGIHLKNKESESWKRLGDWLELKVSLAFLQVEQLYQSTLLYPRCLAMGA